MRYFCGMKNEISNNFTKVMKNGIFMKKFCALCCISVCLSTSLYAAEGESLRSDSNEENKNRFVVGIYGGGGIMQMSSEYYTTAYPIDDLPGDYDKSMFGASFGVKAGYDMYFFTRHGVRLYLDYMNSYFNSNERTLGTFNMHTIGLNADYRFVIMGGLSAFAGAGLAHNIINTQYLGNMNAFGGSFNLGVAYELSFLEFEFRLRYLAYDIPDKSSSYLPTILGQATKYHLVDLNSPINFHLGVNFRF